MSEPEFRDVAAGQTPYPLRKTAIDRPEAVTVDLIEPGTADGDGSGTITVPRYVLVNGRSVFTPSGTKVKIETEPGGSEVQVSLTFMARRIRIGFADELGVDLAAALAGGVPPWALALARAYAAGDGAVLDFAGEPVPAEVQEVLAGVERVPGDEDGRMLAFVRRAGDEWGAVRVAQAALLLATGHDPAGRDVAAPPGQDGPDAPLWRGWTRHGASIPGMAQLGERPPAARCTGTRSCTTCMADAGRARALVLGLPLDEAPEGGTDRV